MENESIELPKDLMLSIKEIVEKTGAYNDAQDFVQDAVMKQIRRYKEV